MIKVFGSKHCPDCVNFKYNLDRNTIPYEYIDITDSMKNLKMFLRLRDNDATYEETKQKGNVGIPSIVFEDGTIDLDWENYLKKREIEVIYPDQMVGKACGLDGTGC